MFDCIWFNMCVKRWLADVLCEYGNDIMSMISSTINGRKQIWMDLHKISRPMINHCQQIQEQQCKTMWQFGKTSVKLCKKFVYTMLFTFECVNNSPKYKKKINDVGYQVLVSMYIS